MVEKTTVDSSRPGTQSERFDRKTGDPQKNNIFYLISLNLLPAMSASHIDLCCIESPNYLGKSCVTCIIKENKITKIKNIQKVTLLFCVGKKL